MEFSNNFGYFIYHYKQGKCIAYDSRYKTEMETFHRIQMEFGAKLSSQEIPIESVQQKILEILNHK